MHLDIMRNFAQTGIPLVDSSVRGCLNNGEYLNNGKYKLQQRVVWVIKRQRR